MRTSKSSGGMPRCRTLYVTAMLARENRPAKYALLRVRLLSSRSTMNPSAQTFSLTTISPPGRSPAAARLRNETTSSSVRYSKHHCTQMQS